jgi:hypothetical protein
MLSLREYESSFFRHAEAQGPQLAGIGNASGSTLRLTLGCLLAHRLGIRPRRVNAATHRTHRL